MALIPESEVRSVTGITDQQKELAKAYLQGAVYSWIRDRPNEIFAARDLIGGANFYWEGTPLMPLYEKHVAKGKSNDDAVTAAARDAGWLLKSVLNDDKRNFTIGKSGLTAGYKWIGNEP